MKSGRLCGILIVLMALAYLTPDVGGQLSKRSSLPTAALGRIAVQTFREKNGLPENLEISASKRPIGRVGPYVKFLLHENSLEGVSTDHEVWMYRDGSTYLEGRVVKIPHLTDKALLPLLEEQYPHLDDVHLRPSNMIETRSQRGIVLIQSKTDIDHKQPYTYNETEHILVLGTVYNVLTQAQKNRVAMDGASVLLGNPNGKSHLVIFSDFECPYCAAREGSLDVQQLINTNNDLAVVFRDYPLEFHPWARTAAIAARCVYELAPARYLRFRSALFGMQRRLSLRNIADRLEEQVTGMGIDAARFSECQRSSSTLNNLAADIDAGNRLQLALTPSVYLDGKLIVDDRSLQTSTGRVPENCNQGCAAK